MKELVCFLSAFLVLKYLRRIDVQNCRFTRREQIRRDGGGRKLACDQRTAKRYVV